jgi:hypothetical protein
MYLAAAHFSSFVLRTPPAVSFRLLYHDYCELHISFGTLYCCDGLQKCELKVNMCCAKCAEKVKEEIFEVAGE